jgi:hypothetical protein
MILRRRLEPAGTKFSCGRWCRRDIEAYHEMAAAGILERGACVTPIDGEIIDLAGAAVEVFRQPKQGTYAACERRASGGLSPLLLPSVVIDVATLLA